MCLFCIAVFAVLAGAITTAVLDRMEEQIASVAVPETVSRLTNSEATAVISCQVPIPAVAGQQRPRLTAAPVLVTVYKAQKRVRIQVQTHEVSSTQAEAIQDKIAVACGLKVVSRSSDATQHIVHDAQAPFEPTAAAARTPGAVGSIFRSRSSS